MTYKLPTIANNEGPDEGQTWGTHGRYSQVTALKFHAFQSSHAAMYIAKLIDRRGLVVLSCHRSRTIVHPAIMEKYPGGRLTRQKDGVALAVYAERAY